MNSKKIILLAVLLALALGAIVLVKTLGDRKPSEETLKFFPAASEKMIGSVLIKDAQNQVLLKRKGDAWFMVPKEAIPASMKKGSGLAGAMGESNTPSQKPPAGLSASEFPADSGTIAQLLQNIVVMKKNTLISENPANQAAFEVDSAKGLNVETFDINGRSLGNVILGKNGADYNSIYARSIGSNIVYLMLDVSRYAFATDNNRWTDKSIMKFDKATVKQVSIAKKGAPSIVIARGDSLKKGWQLLAPPKKPNDTNKIDSTKVDEVLSALSGLMAAEYEYGTPTDSAIGFGDPSIIVTLNFAGGTTRTLVIGNQKTGQSKFWVKVPEKQFVYLINDNDQKKFDKKPEDFEKQALKPIQAVPAPLPKKFKMPLKK
jgi:hypothetical protein